MANKKQCACGNKVYCKLHSKVKMVVMVKDQYKASMGNTSFYSFFKEDGKPQITLILKMIERLEKKFKNAYNCILFYDNQNKSNNVPIHVHK